MPRPPRRGSLVRAGGAGTPSWRARRRSRTRGRRRAGPPAKLDHPSRPERKCTGGTVETQRVQPALAHELFLGRYRPDPPPRLGRDGPCLARPRREERPRRRPEDRRPRGQGGQSRRTRGRAASSLRHPRCQRILALARDPPTSTSPTSTCRADDARGAPRRRARRPAAIEVRAQIRGARARARGAGSSTATSSRRTCCSPRATSVDVRLLDFGLAQMAEFDTLTALGDVPGTLALHRARAAAGLPATPPPTSGRSASSSGRRSPASIRSGRRPRRRPRAASSRARRRSRRCAPTCRATSLETVDGALVDEPAAPADRRAARRRAARRCRGGAAGASRAGAGRAAPSRSPRLRATALLPGALAGVASGWVAAALPFYPAGWPLGLAAVAATLGFASPRAGLAVRARGRVLPARQHLPRPRGAVRRARSHLAAPELARRASGPARRGGPSRAARRARGCCRSLAQVARGRPAAQSQAAAAVLLAAVVAGLRRVPLPFDGSTPPLGLGLAGSTRPRPSPTRSGRSSSRTPSSPPRHSSSPRPPQRFRSRAAVGRGPPCSSRARSSP